MIFQVADQSGSRPLQAVPTNMLDGPAYTASEGDNVSGSEVLRIEMMVAGELLIDALRIEQEFRIVLAQGYDSVLDKWRAAGKHVERMSEDYTSAVLKWRESLQDLVEKGA